MHRSILPRTVPALALTLLMTVALAGCTASGAGTGTTPPQDCGHIQARLGAPGGSGSSAGSALTCFYHAHQNCQPATLTYTTFGVDAGSTYTFTVQRKGSGCALTDSHDHFIAPNPPRHVGTYTCSGLARQQDGSLIAQSCGLDGDITIPAAATP